MKKLYVGNRRRNSIHIPQAKQGTWITKGLLNSITEGKQNQVVPLEWEEVK